MLLSMAERRLGVAERLARYFPDRRDPARITHTLADMIRARILARACQDFRVWPELLNIFRSSPL